MDSSGVHSTISEMMESYAAEAVRLADGFRAELDYSESSLQTLEGILAQICSGRPASVEEGANRPAQEELDSASRVWGGYFGEVLRRLWGGEWGVETYPGTVAPVVSVDVGGAKVFPVMKVYRRLTQGEQNNIWSFYQMVREKIQAQAKQ